MAIKPLRNKKTKEVKYLDESYVRVFPDSWEHADKQAVKKPVPVKEPAVKTVEKEGKNA